MLSSFVRRRSIVAALSISSVRSAKQSTRTSTVGETENGFRRQDNRDGNRKHVPMHRVLDIAVLGSGGHEAIITRETREHWSRRWEMRGFLSVASYTLGFF